MKPSLNRKSWIQAPTSIGKKILIRPSIFHATHRLYFSENLRMGEIHEWKIVGRFWKKSQKPIFIPRKWAFLLSFIIESICKPKFHVLWNFPGSVNVLTLSESFSPVNVSSNYSRLLGIVVINVAMDDARSETTDLMINDRMEVSTICGIENSDRNESLFWLIAAFWNIENEIKYCFSVNLFNQFHLINYRNSKSYIDITQFKKEKNKQQRKSYTGNCKLNK